jgi:hypothetical protein
MNAHFRAHARRPVRFPVTLIGLRTSMEAPAVLIDLSLAGAGFECVETVYAGDRLSIAFPTPTMWDPLVVSALVAWARPGESVDNYGRSRAISRAGVTFDYPTPDTVLSMYEMLTAIGYE